MAGVAGEPHPDLEMLEAAWGIIANAWGGNWDLAGDDWLAAATNWRDRYLEITQLDTGETR